MRDYMGQERKVESHILFFKRHVPIAACYDRVRLLTVSIISRPILPYIRTRVCTCHRKNVRISLAQHVRLLMHSLLVGQELVVCGFLQIKRKALAQPGRSSISVGKCLFCTNYHLGVQCMYIHGSGKYVSHFTFSHVPYNYVHVTYINF